MPGLFIEAPSGLRSEAKKKMVEKDHGRHR
jgi:hypothetical protein